MIRDFKSDLLETNLFGQTIVELLVEKEILTKEEVEERLIENQKLFMKPPMNSQNSSFSRRNQKKGKTE